MKIVPVVIGAFGTTPRLLRKRIVDNGIETRIVDLQKSAILYFARILRKVLEVSGDLLSPSLKKTSLLNILACNNQ